MRNILITMILCLCLGLVGCQGNDDSQQTNGSSGDPYQSMVQQENTTEEHATVEFTGDNFQKQVLECNKVVLVDFWAPS